MISEGTFTAKPYDWGIVERGDYVKVVISFKTEDDQYGTWSGSLDDPVFIKYSLNAMKLCGFEPKSKEELLDGLTRGPEDSPALDKEAVVKIVVEHTTTQDGKTYANVKYINPFGSKFSGILTKEQAAQRLAGINMESLFGKVAADTTPQSSKEEEKNLDDLPF